MKHPKFALAAALTESKETKYSDHISFQMISLIREIRILFNNYSIKYGIHFNANEFATETNNIHHSCITIHVSITTLSHHLVSNHCTQMRN